MKSMPQKLDSVIVNRVDRRLSFLGRLINLGDRPIPKKYAHLNMRNVVKPSNQPTLCKSEQT